ncbi:MAG: ABC transporter permease [Rikenellaceae bacterium]
MNRELKLIIEKEFYERISKKSFIIGTLLTPILLVAMMVLPSYFMAQSMESDPREVVNIVVYDSQNIIADKLSSSEFVIYKDRGIESEAKAKSIVEEGEADGALIVDDLTQFTYYYKDKFSQQSKRQVKDNLAKVVRNCKISGYEIENINEIIKDINADIDLNSYKLTDEGAVGDSTIMRMIVGMIFSFMIYMFVIMYGNQIAMSVIAEKSSRVIELIVSHVRPFWFMLGKIIGIGLVGLLQVVVWVVLTFIVYWIISTLGIIDTDVASISSAAEIASNNDVNQEVIKSIAAASNPIFLLKILTFYLIYFLGGYALYGAMFAALGSAVENPQELNQFVMPIMMPLIFALMVSMSAQVDPSGGLVKLLSFIPFTSPVAMMARIPSGEVAIWEITLSITLLLLTAAFVVYLAGKIFRVGLFMYGKGSSWKEILKWIRYN